MSMSSYFTKENYLETPSQFAWNILLMRYQFTQEELLAVREYIDLPNMIKYQKCLTHAFLREHFEKDINDCYEVDWNDVNKYLSQNEK